MKMNKLEIAFCKSITYQTAIIKEVFIWDLRVGVLQDSIHLVSHDDTDHTPASIQFRFKIENSRKTLQVCFLFTYIDRSLQIKWEISKTLKLEATTKWNSLQRRERGRHA